MRLNISRPDGVKFKMDDSTPGSAGAGGAAQSPQPGTQIAPQFQQALMQSATAPAAAGPTAPDAQLLQQGIAGMMPTADRATFNSGQEALGLYGARQRAQQAQMEQARQVEDMAVQDALDAQARESDLARVGRIVSSLMSQSIVPPGHAVR